MKNNEFQELVDQNLSGLVWDEKKRFMVLQAVSEEEKPMKKKVSMTFILVAAIICLSVTALAAGLIFANRISVKQTAEQAVYNKYGVTDTMLASFFSSKVEEKSDKEATVVFSGTYAVLGDYTVDIRDGKADASWSFEGRDTSGMFDAEAWGLEQLQEMLRATTTDHDVTSFFHKAEEIEKKIKAENGPEDAERKELQPAGKAEAMAAAAKAGRSAEDLILLAKDAIAEAYRMTPEQRAKLESPYETEDIEREDIEDWLVTYYTEEGNPLFEVRIGLQQQQADGNEEFPPFTEKDGFYFVTINVETGVIENIEYETDLNGNG